MAEFNFVITFVIANIIEISQGTYSIGIPTWIGYLLLLGGVRFLFTSDEMDLGTKLPLYTTTLVSKTEYTKGFSCKSILFLQYSPTET